MNEHNKTDTTHPFPGPAASRVRPAIDYLRISITDRCNFRCNYCMPPEGVEYKDHKEILSYEEILKFAGAAAALGVTRVRVTGGEPLVRKGCTEFIGQLARIPGIEDIALTTNGYLLKEHARELKEARLSRVNISIDSLDSGRFAEITRGGDLEKALGGLDEALATGLAPVKVNVVMLDGVEDELEAYVSLAREKAVHVRFIEFMPIGRRVGGLWKFISRERLFAGLKGFGELKPADSPGGGGPARYFKFDGAAGTIGFISSMSDHFCSSCNRLRLTADGKLRNCLFADDEVDIRPYLNGGHKEPDDGGQKDSDNGQAKLKQVILDSMNSKKFSRDGADPGCRTMSQIGG